MIYNGGKINKIAKIAAGAVGPILLVLSLMKPGATWAYDKWKKLLNIIIYRSRDGFHFLINLGGIPLKGIIFIIGKLPILLTGVGGFAMITALAGKSYLTWLSNTWKWFKDGWVSAPLFTWTKNKKKSIMRIVKKGDGVKGKAGIIVDTYDVNKQIQQGGGGRNKKIPLFKIYFPKNKRNTKKRRKTKKKRIK